MQKLAVAPDESSHVDPDSSKLFSSHVSFLSALDDDNPPNNIEEKYTQTDLSFDEESKNEVNQETKNQKLRFTSQNLPISSSFLYQKNEDLKSRLQFISLGFGLEGDQIPDGLTEDHLEAYLKSIKRTHKTSKLMARDAYYYSSGKENWEAYEVVSKIISYFEYFFIGFLIYGYGIQQTEEDPSLYRVYFYFQEVYGTTWDIFFKELRKVASDKMPNLIFRKPYKENSDYHEYQARPYKDNRRNYRGARGTRGGYNNDHHYKETRR